MNKETVPPSAELAIRPGQHEWTGEQRSALATMGLEKATPGDLAVFFHYCQKTGLDPFSKQIYGIMRREKTRQYVDGQAVDAWTDKFTIQVGIDGFRVIRDRAAKRDGVTVEYEDTLWYDGNGKAHKVWLWPDPPAACSFAVLKDGRRYPAVLTFAEYVQVTSNGYRTGKWANAPAHQIEKCAEAFALRRAFPQDLGGIYLEDEAPPPPDETGTAPNGNPARRGTVTVAAALGKTPAQTEPADPPDEAAAPKVRPAQLTQIARLFSRLGYGDGDTAERLDVARQLAVPGITSLEDLTRTQAEALYGTLKGCPDRGALIGLLATATAQEDNGPPAGGEGGGDAQLRVHPADPAARRAAADRRGDRRPVRRWVQ